MGNLLRQAFGLDEEYNKKVLEWIDEQRKESIKNKECCVCDHFYDYSTGVSTDYGCELPDHNDYAILDKKGCCDWVLMCEQNESDWR